MPAQVLAGNGLTPRRVVFVDKGRGLWLTEDARAKPLSGGLHFDFDKGRLRRATGEPTLSQTHRRSAIGPGRSIRTARPCVFARATKHFRAVVLKDKEVVTAVALRPLSAVGPALLAVALTDRDNARTLILLRRPEDDTPFRLLIGHLQDVGQLAFSASRPLLASVAEDQTVCVWGLTDLDKAIGQVAGSGNRRRGWQGGRPSGPGWKRRNTDQGRRARGGRAHPLANCGRSRTRRTSCLL